MVSVVFLLPVSDSVSGPIKNPQSGKIREDSGKISGKSNNYYKGQGQELKTTVIYIYAQEPVVVSAPPIAGIAVP